MGCIPNKTGYFTSCSFGGMSVLMCGVLEVLAETCRGDKSISPFPLDYPQPKPQTGHTDGTLNFSNDGSN